MSREQQHSRKRAHLHGFVLKCRIRSSCARCCRSFAESHNLCHRGISVLRVPQQLVAHLNVFTVQGRFMHNTRVVLQIDCALFVT